MIQFAVLRRKKVDKFLSVMICLYCCSQCLSDEKWRNCELWHEGIVRSHRAPWKYLQAHDFCTGPKHWASMLSSRVFRALWHRMGVSPRIPLQFYFISGEEMFFYKCRNEGTVFTCVTSHSHCDHYWQWPPAGRTWKSRGILHWSGKSQGN